MVQIPWFKVDDGLAFHAKTITAGNAAMGLWVRAGSWCSQQLTDGHIPNHVVKQMGRIPEADRLVNAGLWDAVEGGYRFHEWGQRNPLRVKVEQSRKDGAKRLADHRAAKKAEAEARGETDV